MIKINNQHVSCKVIKKKIYELKHGNNFKIKIFFDTEAYYLVLVTENQHADMQLIKLLASWRKKHEKWFPAIFPVSLQRTKNWLSDKVINEPDRILFMIKVRNQYIGHIGLYRFNFQKGNCEIDNIVRGVDKYPGIMEHAIRQMMHWGQAEFGITTYMLSTTSDNQRALRLYQKLGFTEVERIPMIRLVKSDRIEWQNASENYKGTIQRYDVIMKLPYENI